MEKTVRVHAAQAIGESIAIGIRGKDGVADGLTRRRVLRQRARHGWRGDEHRRAVDRIAEALGEDQQVIEADTAVVVQIARRIVSKAHGYAGGILNFRSEDLYGDRLIGPEVERGDGLVAIGIVQIQCERKPAGLGGRRPRVHEKRHVKQASDAGRKGVCFQVAHKTDKYHKNKCLWST